MTSRTPQTLRVGIVMSAALALLMIGVFFVGQGQNFWRRKVHYEIRFSRTNGLLVGAPVSLTGVNIGSVVDIGFPPQPDASHIAVDIEVARSLVSRIREDTVASIRTQGVLGDKYVELSAGTAQSPPRQPGSVIPQIDPIDYEAVLGQSGDIVTNFVELTASLRNVLQAIDRGEGLLGAIVRSREQGELTFTDIQSAVAHLAEITGRVERIATGVERGEGILGALVRDTARAEDILSRLTRSAENLDQFTQHLSAGEGVLPRLLKDERLADRLVTNVDETTQDLAEVTAKIRRGEGTLGALVNDPTLYEETTALVRSTRRSWLLQLYRAVRGLWPFEGRPARNGAVGTGDAAGPGGEPDPDIDAENLTTSDLRDRRETRGACVSRAHLPRGRRLLNARCRQHRDLTPHDLGR